MRKKNGEFMDHLLLIVRLSLPYGMYSLVYMECLGVDGVLMSQLRHMARVY
jgi:hypothetical protein